MSDLTLNEISTAVITSINENFDTIEEAVNSKANANGDNNKVFKVAEAIESDEAVNKQLLDSTITAVSSSITEITTTINSLILKTPFCINSGNLTNGVQDLFSYSGGVLTTKSGGSYSDIVSTNSQGIEIIVSSQLLLDMSSFSDGSYNIFMTSQGYLEAYSNTIYRQTSEPSSPSTNDIWFNIGIESAQAHIYNGSDFSTKYTGVPIGTATLASGIITAVTTFPFNFNGIGRKLIESYQNGTSWYNVFLQYDSYTKTIRKWIEQGGTSGETQVTFLKPFANSDWGFNLNVLSSGSNNNDSALSPFVQSSSKLTTGFILQRYARAINDTILYYWTAYGY